MRIKFISPLLFASSLILLLALSNLVHAQDFIEPKAQETLKRMSDYMNALQDFSFHSAVSIDVIENSNEKIEHQRQADIKIQRPNRLKAKVIGDIKNLSLYYNGKTITIYNPDKNMYGVVEAKETIEAALDEALAQFGIQSPLTEIIYKNNYDLLTKEASQGRYIGLSQINGVECHHLAFIQDDLSWQIWIDAGEKPLPRKVIFTNTKLNGWPDFSAILSDWNISAKLAPSIFEFLPPENAMQIKVLKSKNSTLGAS